MRETTGRNIGCAASSEPDLDERRRVVAEVLPDVVGDGVRAAQGRQDVDEAQQLDAKVGVAGRPVEQALLPPVRRQDEGLAAPSTRRAAACRSPGSALRRLLPSA